MRYYHLFENKTYAEAEVTQYQEDGATVHDCSELGITSLQGCNEKIDGNFYCGRNPLTSLQYGPKIVTGVFNCSWTQLTSLEHAPHTVGNEFSCRSTPTLVSLNGAPKNVHSFFIMNTGITSLKGSPDTVSSYLVHDNPNLTSWEGAPKLIKEKAVISCFPSLSGIHKYFPNITGQLVLVYEPGNLPSNILNVFNIEGLKSVRFFSSLASDSVEINKIMDDYIPMGKKGMMKCQLALIKAGFKDQAKL